jgi:hypothetical protein
MEGHEGRVSLRVVDVALPVVNDLDKHSFDFLKKLL